MPSRFCQECRELIPANQYEAHRQAHKNAIKPPHWKNPANRRKALQRDGYRCRKCGRSQAQLKRLGLQLHVHHVNGRQDERVEALLSLCEECHDRRKP